MLPVVFGSFFRVFSCTRLALFPVFFGSFSVFVLIEAACFSMYVDELSLASLTLFPGKLTFDGMRWLLF